MDAQDEPESNGANVESNVMSIEELKSKQKEERKQLQASIQKLKNNAPKNNKKQRKAAVDAASGMENEMKLRHASEIAELEQKLNSIKIEREDSVDVTSSLADGDDQNQPADDKKEPRLSKAQRRRDAKANKEREKELQRAALAEDEKNNSKKELEKRAIQTKLEALSLVSHSISSDGNCLYNAIRHQLQVNDLPLLSVEELRSAAAKYIRNNKDLLIDYMLDPATGLPISDDTGFENYCYNVEKTTTWGGHIELKAISDALKVKITVLHADAPATILEADRDDAPELVITFHQYLYQLGEHYNSTTSADNGAISPDEEDF